jgi:capsular polysaccharide biosynthesis protein
LLFHVANFSTRIAQDAGAHTARIKLLRHERAAPIAMPPLPLGEVALKSAPMIREWNGVSWTETSYEPAMVIVLCLRNVLVHGAGGMMALDDSILWESLLNTPLDGAQNGTMIDLPLGPVKPMPGRHVSILTGSANNFFHAVIDGPARLIALRPDHWQDVQGIFCSKDAPMQLETLARIPDARNIPPIMTSNGESFLVQELVLPLSLHCVAAFNPLLKKFFEIMESRAKPTRKFGAKIYLDRRGHWKRRLRNETELATRLEAEGFESVMPETLSLDEQISLFAGAECIVASHGAGLTNLGFCRPGTMLIELVMDHYANWSFRRFTACFDLGYDCVLGEATNFGPDIKPGIHPTDWHIDCAKVVDAIKYYGFEKQF